MNRIILTNKAMNRITQIPKNQARNGIHPARTHLEHRVFNNSCFIQAETARLHFHNDFTDLERRIYVEMALMGQYVPVLFPSHKYIADRVGCHPSTVKRAITTFKVFGLMTVNRWREWSNVYHLPSIFNEYFSRKSLIALLNAYKYLSLFLLLSKARSDANDLLLNNKGYVYNQTVNDRESHSTEIEGNALAQIPQPKLRLKEKKTMTATERLKKIQELMRMGFPLTDHGICKLAAYPPQAVSTAWDRRAIAIKAIDPWAFFMAQCQAYCDVNKITPDWQIYFELKKGFGIAQDDTIYLEPAGLEEFKSQQREGSSFVKQEQTPSLSKQQKLYPVHKPPVAPRPLARTANTIQLEMKDWLGKLALAQETNNEFLKDSAENILRNLTEELLNLTF